MFLYNYGYYYNSRVVFRIFVYLLAYLFIIKYADKKKLVTSYVFYFWDKV